MNGGGVEASEDGGTVDLGTVLGSTGRGGVEEAVAFAGLGNLDEGVVGITFEVAEEDSGELVLDLSELVTGELLGGGAGLLVDPLDDGVLGAATSVVLTLSVSANSEFIKSS